MQDGRTLDLLHDRNRRRLGSLAVDGYQATQPYDDGELLAYSVIYPTASKLMLSLLARFTGTILSTLPRTRRRSHPSPLHHLPLLLLGPLQDSLLLGNWRHLHECCLPGDSDGERAAAQLSGFVRSRLSSPRRLELTSSRFFLPEIRYYDTISFRHKDTNAFLHSHAEKYPLRYDDGRVSSQGSSSLFDLPSLDPS